MKYLIDFLGFLIKATIAAFAIALLLIFLATLTTAIGLELSFPPFFSSLPDQFSFLNPVFHFFEPIVNAVKSFGSFVGEKLQFLGPTLRTTQSFVRSTGDFMLLWGHRIMVFAIIGGMIYFILSILKNW
ncbi:hypothetical protein [Oscillatoria sp. FACHB-1406]|uniref:hypothetical protein n=1 Tax=Oscillatoria sp. FACHB-1406 TaxID=2692846 RepID=UPI001685C1F2|nr:hypothetical protein [Oscillatoria sp. FACHB-1406]MBD2577332.1 hypothetical protein [Oscillatoria sp. FACHB-1406]